MHESPILASLNPKQQEAVSAPACHLLILAGAGSGKTRVLVHRIAWLMQHLHVSPFSILAVTFTNKAANEMRGRIEALYGMPLSGTWIGTFHGLAHRMLRAHWQDADLLEAFQIIDTDDQLRMVKRIHKSLALDESKWPPKQSQWYINKCKEEGKRPQHIGDTYSHFDETMKRVYEAYQEVCERSGLVDFSELLLRSLELLQKKPEIAKHYQQRFEHILVDEFQDTNSIQYSWIKALCSDKTAVMAVGDDDQSIYSWRGADIENLHRFTKEFPDTKTIRLEQNYRSTKTILNAANAVIDNNDNRLGKELWTDGAEGQPITLYSAFNEYDEAHYVTSTIRELFNQGTAYSDMAILYRSNAQSRTFEERLIDSRIPYRIYGGQKFFDRAEIKDALAYLRLLINPNDDAAFERIVNTPTRGIGNTTLNALRLCAKDYQISMWEATAQLIKNKELSARAITALSAFVHLIQKAEEETKDMPLHEQTDHVIYRSGLISHYEKDKSERGQSRIDNLSELISATSQYTHSSDTELSPLAAFLSHVALETGDHQAEQNSDCVNLMTLHSAKGLEFPVVFLAGMEELLFPHKMSIDQPNGLEEERRLCYVGMTRAMEQLYLCYAECRRLHGMEKFNQPSRFIQEIPKELIRAVRPTTKVTPASSYSSYKAPAKSKGPIDETGYQIGQRIKHPKFGAGMIINYEGQGKHTRMQIQFDQAGTKWIVVGFTELEIVS